MGAPSQPANNNGADVAEDKVKYAKLVSRCLECLNVPPIERTKKQLGPLMYFMDKILDKFDLTQNQRLELVRSLSLETYDPGEHVIDMGERGDKWYIILQGKLSVFVPNFQLQDLIKKADTASKETDPGAREHLMDTYRKEFGPPSRQSKIGFEGTAVGTLSEHFPKEISKFEGEVPACQKG
ncbi:hypothetical protein CYMTET_12692 [Cymbomonas tetramitiformis]|uniref:Cyclic nucleotide-binding domain-containing protein n=1 Tax=Cymbomonas tetramitiformis TaxID=36881 RepID=A0AAE0LC65_9CHLO|nr:hypothetical protein CYMTET_12692 [Cymbomonas tetramitiformis]